MTLAELHTAAMADMRGHPVPWDPRMKHWLPRDRYPRIVSNDSSRYYLYLHALVRVLRPRNVLELGTCEGGSAFFMMLALDADAALTTVDLGPLHPWQLGPFLADPRLRRVIGNDLDFSIYGATAPSNVDLLFIDTVHDYDQVKRELQIYQPLLSPGAMIVMDDIHLNDGMKRVWQELQQEKLDAGANLHWSGFGIALPA